MGTLKAGIIYGLTSWKMQCRDCGYQGQPLLFDTQEEWEKFKESLALPVGQTPVAEVEGEQPDARIVDLLEHTPEHEERPEAEEKSWWLEIAVALVVGVVITALEAPSFVQVMGLTAILYIFFFVILVAVVTLAVIIVIEYIYRSVRKSSTKK